MVFVLFFSSSFSPTNFGAGFLETLGHMITDVNHAVGIEMLVIFLFHPEFMARSQYDFDENVVDCVRRRSLAGF